MNQTRDIYTLVNLFKTYRLWIIFLFILALHVFLRFYDIENRSPFAWDQVNNAWAAKQILIDHRYPLLGMVAKQNSGFNIGPAYYYMIAPIYWIFNLDPIASGFIAGLTSLSTFFVLFFVIKKLFSFPIALIAVFLNTVSSYIIIMDRNQWPVNFIAPISLLVFYFLYKILLGNPKYILFLALITGFAFHIHFTAIFFVIMTVLTLPFFPRTKKTVLYILIGLPVFFLWFIPNIVAEFGEKYDQSKNITSYLQNYSHGFHMRRFLQIVWDAFIEVQGILTFEILKFVEILLFPIFFFLYNKSTTDKKRFRTLCYLIVLWMLIPWIVFSLYKGEISNYYFSQTRPIVLMITAYLIWDILQLKTIVPKIVVIGCLLFYSIYNIHFFLQQNPDSISKHRQKTVDNVQRGIHMGFQEGSLESYLYYMYTRKKGK